MFFLIFSLAAFSLVSGSIRIETPVELKSMLNSTIDVKYSLFGSFKYGFSTNGRLYFDPTNIEADYACSPLKEMNMPSELYTIPVIMVERGNCSFTTKVRHIQNIGGKAALIINNKEDDKVIFGINDDGTGTDITIPAMLISKKEGEVIKKFITDNQNNAQLATGIIINIDNSINKLSETIDLHIDFMPGDKRVYTLLSQLMRNSDIISQTQSKVSVIPSYVTKPKANNIHLTDSNCLCQGKYCVPKGIDGFLNSLSSSEDILVEAVRQKCIYKITHDDTNSLHIKDQKLIYWNYMDMFYQECLAAGKEFTVSCSRKVLKELDEKNPQHELNASVEKCFLDSFVNAEGSTSESSDRYLTCEKNNILEEDSNVVENRLKAALPIIYVNDNAFYGSWTYDNVLEAMCANLKDKPASCYLELEGVFSKDDPILIGLSAGQLALIIGVIILVNIILVFYCRRAITQRMNSKITTEEINDKIAAVVQNYIALREVNK